MLRSRQLALTIAILGASACTGESRASSRNAWSLAVSSPGTPPRSRLSYRWDEWPSHPCRLELGISATGLRLPKKARLLLSMETEPRPGGIRLKVTVESSSQADTAQTLWAKGAVLTWDLTPQGHTLGLASAFQPLAGGGPQVDLGLLMERLLPPLPNRAVGAGAAWRVRRRRTVPLPEGTGLGALLHDERIEYRLGRALGSRFLVTWRARFQSSGRVTPLGHGVSVSGGGRLRGTAHMRSGHLERSRVDIQEEYRLVLDGKPKRASVRLRADLVCTGSR